MERQDLQLGKYLTPGCYSASRLVSPLQPYLCYVPGDLQQELAYLRANVFPHLDSLCQARGTCFTPVDIHWTHNVDNDDLRGPNLQPHQACSSRFHQQLKISLDLISSSTSFLCLLGKHYGCFLQDDISKLLGPTEKELSELEKNLHGAVKGGYPWVMGEKHRTCSLVELQITQAVFMCKTMNCFFYFKDYTSQRNEEEEDDDEDTLLSRQKQRLWKLKSWIINTCLPVRFFRNLQELEELVRKDWKGIIDQFHQVPAQHSISGHPDSVEVLYHESHIQALCHVFVPSTQTTEVLELLDKFVFPVTHKAKFRPCSGHSEVQLFNSVDQREPEKSIMLLSGERGCGKSSLAAWWLKTFRKQNPRLSVIPFFCGTSISSKDIRSVLRQCTGELRKVFYGDLPEWSEGLEDYVEPRPLLAEIQALTAAAQLGPCVLLLDGLDLLTDTLGLSLQEVKEMKWLPVALPSLCKLIVTTTNTDLTYKSLTSRSDVQIFTWSGISSPCTQYSILRQHLALPFKNLPTSLQQSNMNRKLRHLPVFLTILGSELRTCGMQREEEEEDELMEEYQAVDSVSQLWVKVIHRWVKDYSRPVEEPTPRETERKRNRPASFSPSLELRGWVWHTLCLIHVSRSGLKEAELLTLLEDLGHCGPLKVQALEWALLRAAFGPWVQQKPNGLLCFSHQSLCQTMELLLMGVVEQQKGRSYFHHILAEFFLRPTEEPNGWLQKLEELPWHLVQTSSFKQLHSVLTHPEAMAFLSSSMRYYPQLRLDLVHYWTLLSKRGYEPISSLQRLLELNDTAVLSSDVPPAREDVLITEVQTHTRKITDPGTLGKLALFSFHILLCLGKTSEAENLLLQAETALQQAGEQDGDSRRLLLGQQHMLAKLYIHARCFEEAKVYCNKGLETANLLTVSSAENIRTIKGQLLCFLYQLELEGGCLLSLPEMLKEISNTGLMSVHPCAEANVTLLKGLHKWRVGELGAAERCLQAALANRRGWYGSEHPLVAAVEEHLADIWTDSSYSDKDWTHRKAAKLYHHVIHVRQSMTQCWRINTFLSKPTLQDLSKTLHKLGEILMQSSCKSERREGLSLLQRAADLSHVFNPTDLLPRDFQALKSDTPAQKPLIITASSRSRTISAGGQNWRTEFPTQTSPPTPRESKMDKALIKPWLAFQTRMFGPQSDLRSLVPGAGLRVSRRNSAQEGPARRPLPTRHHIHKEAVKTLNRQMGTPSHNKTTR